MEEKGRGMTFIVKTVTRLTLGFILLYGLYVTISGHKSPGGGFAGGVIIALSLIHVMLAFGKDAALKKLKVGALNFLTAFASIMFLALTAQGLFMKANAFTIYTREIVLPLAVMSLVGFGLFYIFTAFVVLYKKDS